MEATNNKDAVSVLLNHDEALVLLAWLHRFNEIDDFDQKNIIDQAEERILYDLESIIERILPAILDGNYKELLLKAREKIRDEE